MPRFGSPTARTRAHTPAHLQDIFSAPHHEDVLAMVALGAFQHGRVDSLVWCSARGVGISRRPRACRSRRERGRAAGQAAGQGGARTHCAVVRRQVLHQSDLQGHRWGQRVGGPLWRLCGRVAAGGGGASVGVHANWCRPIVAHLLGVVAQRLLVGQLAHERRVAREGLPTRRR